MSIGLLVARQSKSAGRAIRCATTTHGGESRNRRNSLLKTVLRCQHEPSHGPSTDGIRDYPRAVFLSSPSSAAPLNRSQRLLALAAVIVCFVVARGLVMLSAMGGQDEEWYAIPGLMVARTGVPSVPYSHATEKSSVFLGAERLLFAMPPATFYAQAPFFLVAPPTYGTARLASLMAGCVAIAVVFLLGRELFDDDWIGLWGAAIFSLSRLLYFPATFARPDMLCGMFGLLTMLMLARWLRGKQIRDLLIAGIFLGLAGLSHPFAIVFAIQGGAWILWSTRGGTRKIVALLVLGATTAGTFLLWLPLIAMAPDLFMAQFVSNIVSPAGPGLLSRLVWPWESFQHHWPQLVDRAHPLQGGVLLLGWAALPFLRRLTKKNVESESANPTRERSMTCWWLAGTSVYLLIAAQGQHPIQGYWCYSAGLFCLCLAASLRHIQKSCFGSGARAWIFAPLAIMGVLLTFLPGSGLRAVVAYATHLGDTNFYSPRFIRQVLSELPAEAKLTVGIEFALDAYGQGREVVLGIENPMYFDSSEVPTDYLILGRLGLAERLQDRFDCERIAIFGDPKNEFACYAEVFRVHRPPSTVDGNLSSGREE